MPMGRFLVPSLAFQTLLIGSFCGFLRARNFERSARLFALAIAALGVLPDFDTQLVPQSIRERFPFRLSNASFWEEKDAWRGMKEISPLLRERGEALARFTKPGESLVASSIGYVGYYSNLIIYDRFGLVSRIRPSGAAKRLGSPGHDVHVHPHYFLRQKPTYLYSMFYDEQRLKALAGRRERYPPPYAPIVFPIAEDRYLVLIKRHDSRQAYHEAWQSYENTYADSPGAR
jgi:hypothetical protein